MWLRVGLLQFKLSTPPPASSVVQALIETPGSHPAPLEGPAESRVIQGHLRIMTAIHPLRPQSSVFGSSIDVTVEMQKCILVLDRYTKVFWANVQSVQDLSKPTSRPACFEIQLILITHMSGSLWRELSGMNRRISPIRIVIRHSSSEDQPLMVLVVGWPEQILSSNQNFFYFILGQSRWF